MKIVILGAGAIGGLVAGYLKSKQQDVSLVARAESIKAIKEGGLRICGARGDVSIKIEISDKLSFKPDLLILATKTQDVEKAIRDNLEFIKDTLILTTQNGIQADNLVRGYIPQENIISSIIMFAGTYLQPGRIVHNFEGNWIIGRVFGQNDAGVTSVSQALSPAFCVIVSERIKGMKYLKIFVNAGNCIPAILGRSMQEVFSDVDISRININIWREALDIVNKAGIELTSLPNFPLERLTKLAAMPSEQAAKIFSGIMQNLSKEPLYGSILQSIKRGRPSEIDYINGEFLRIAKANGLTAPLNAKLVEMVHRVEKTNRFFSKEELLSGLKEPNSTS
jgi:2-dehydropantoate 2-reductase